MDESWEQVYAGCYRRLVALVAAVAGSLPEAEEAVQEAFVPALGPAGRRALVDNPQAWVYRVAVNVVRSRWRRVATGQRRRTELAGLVTPTAVDMEASESRLALLAALRRLPFQQREALALHYFADLAVEEIAVRVGAPAGTIKARLSRGREALAKMLSDPVSEGSGHV